MKPKATRIPRARERKLVLASSTDWIREGTVIERQSSACVSDGVCVDGAYNLAARESIKLKEVGLESEVTSGVECMRTVSGSELKCFRWIN
jgi:hypothetical protein